MASITKLMTALVALDHASLDDVATISRSTASIGESTINLRPGERVTLRDLIRAALVQSANDAANAIAAFVGRGSVGRFVELMNARARQLGLTDTHFANPDGLDAPGHVSSARDVTKLARVAMRTAVHPRDGAAGRRDRGRAPPAHVERPALDLPEPARRQDRAHERRRLVAGGCCASRRRHDLRDPARRRDARGPQQRSRRSCSLWGLSRYRTVWAIDGARTYGTVRTAYGKPAVRVVAAKPALRVIHVERPLVERVVLPVEAALPVRKGQRLGEVQVLDRGTVIARSPLVAANAVERPGTLGRVGFYAGRTLDHLGGLFG